MFSLLIEFRSSPKLALRLLDALSMFKCFVILLGFTPSAYAQEHPLYILHVYQDFLRPGSDPAYRKIEEDTVRICVELSIRTPTWRLSRSPDPRRYDFSMPMTRRLSLKQVGDEYQRNAPPGGGA